eukprot:9604053-Alexandrium_andersonii.AAC.1
MPQRRALTRKFAAEASRKALGHARFRRPCHWAESVRACVRSCGCQNRRVDVKKPAEAGCFFERMFASVPQGAQPPFRRRVSPREQ